MHWVPRAWVLCVWAITDLYCELVELTDDFDSTSIKAELYALVSSDQASSYFVDPFVTPGWGLEPPQEARRFSHSRA